MWGTGSRRALCPHAAPGEASPATGERLPPEPFDAAPKGLERRTVHRDPVVAGVPENDRPPISALLGKRSVPTALEFEPELTELGLQPLTHRLPQHRKLPMPGGRATVREAQKGEGCRFPRATGSPVGRRKTPKLRSAPPA